MLTLKSGDKISPDLSCFSCGLLEGRNIPYFPQLLYVVVWYLIHNECGPRQTICGQCTVYADVGSPSVWLGRAQHPLSDAAEPSPSTSSGLTLPVPFHPFAGTCQRCLPRALFSAMLSCLLDHEPVKSRNLLFSILVPSSYSEP